MRSLADADGVTMDEELRRLARAERQRRIGLSLAAERIDEEAQQWIDISAATVRDEGG